MHIGVVKETKALEFRVGLVPAVLSKDYSALRRYRITITSPASCPRLSRASTPFLVGFEERKTWMAGTSLDKPGHDAE
jgi:hypothetical protein